MVVHVVRGDGLSGVSLRRWARCASSPPASAPPCTPSSATTCPTALLDFAREMNATQLVIGTSRRSRWARIFDEGIGAAIVQQSGKIDVHMVTHDGGQTRVRRCGRRLRADSTG